MFKTLKDISEKIILLGPVIYAFFNYFFVIKEEQRFTFMGWAWLIVSIVYFVIALYFAIKNW
ncbi:hypothetical protein [endosymbiont DhMRE of Dentiscutata heterogama]|uniref:hypothetical protein n=1 Tax=endosymbiont DhMRE of Dentiscutata heterogama TaxID=1609546 RepID=UPI002AD3F7F1|nr:hypothetical protein [endosymbiont DhMRE of Dentiscutata heterogama]